MGKGVGLGSWFMPPKMLHAFVGRTDFGLTRWGNQADILFRYYRAWLKAGSSRVGGRERGAKCSELHVGLVDGEFASPKPTAKDAESRAAIANAQESLMPEDIQIRLVHVEFLRPGPPHNQLLSPLTPYLAISGDAGAGVITVPYEHAEFERRLKELRYETGDSADRQA